MAALLASVAVMMALAQASHSNGTSTATTVLMVPGLVSLLTVDSGKRSPAMTALTTPAVTTAMACTP